LTEERKGNDFWWAAGREESPNLPAMMLQESGGALRPRESGLRHSGHRISLRKAEQRALDSLVLSCAIIKPR